MDLCTSGKGLALSSEQEVAILCVRFAFARSAGPPKFTPSGTGVGSLVGSLGETRARSSGCTPDGCGDTIDDFSANGGVSAEENPEFSGGLDG
jgi:hypothetical protein